MTRFQQELSGALGEYWERSAKKELERVRKDLEGGKITIDSCGVAHNCIGRVLMDDMLEKVAMLTDMVDVKATRAARDTEVEKFLSEYRRNAKPASDEELAEMQAAFGAGATVVNVLTGERYRF